MRYVLVKNGIVVNVIEWDGESEYPLEEGVTAEQSDTLNIGDDPLNPPVQPDPNDPPPDPEPVEVTVDGLRVRNSEGDVSLITADNDGNLHVNPEA